MTLMKCSECGHDVSDKAQMCPGCGAPVAPWRCSACGEDLSFRMSECPACGANVDWSDELIAVATPSRTADSADDGYPGFWWFIAGLVLVVLSGVANVLTAPAANDYWVEAVVLETVLSPAAWLGVGLAFIAQRKGWSNAGWQMIAIWAGFILLAAVVTASHGGI